MLTDSNFLAKSLPDAEDVHVLDSTSFEAKMKLRVAVVSSTLKMKMTVTGSEAPSKASLSAEGAGSGSSIRIASMFELQGDNPTLMRWSADADITGVMAGLGSTLLKGFATRKIAEMFEGITKSLESSV